MTSQRGFRSSSDEEDDARKIRAYERSLQKLGKAYRQLAETSGAERSLPVFRIDEHGLYEQMATLTLRHPHGTVLEWLGDCPWPLKEDELEGSFEGLPYFLQDLWPNGFLGRAAARAHGRLLGLPPDPSEWSDEDVLRFLTRLGADAVGNHVIGSVALTRHLSELQNPREILQEAHLPAAYARLADEALAGGAPISLLGGEFAKFTALREAGGICVNVLVKFSPSDDSPTSQRWADLLVCEHLAARTLTEVAGIQAVDTRILQAAGRTFLESVRFDRHGLSGRSAVCSWAAVNWAWFGLTGPRSWTDGAVALRERGLVEQQVVEDVECVWYFGLLIANSDMHDGNLSYRPHRTGSRAGFALAPVYDMLPMRYAPLQSAKLPWVEFDPPLPLPAEREAWARAARTAVEFWDRVAPDARISDGFRAIAAENRERVRRAMELAGVSTGV